MTETILDCKGLQCPMPIVKISRMIKTLNSGDTLIVEATDPAFKPDLEAWSKKTGNSLLEFIDGDVRKAIIQKSKAHM